MNTFERLRTLGGPLVLMSELSPKEMLRLISKSTSRLFNHMCKSKSNVSRSPPTGNTLVCVVPLLSSSLWYSRSTVFQNVLTCLKHWPPPHVKVCMMLKETYGPRGRLLSKSTQSKRSISPLSAYPSWSSIILPLTNRCFNQRRLQKYVFPSLVHLCIELMFDLEYWVNLGTSTVFQGEVLWNCVSRIHQDVLKVWNFHNPLKVRFVHQSTAASRQCFTLSCSLGRTFVLQWLGSLNPW